MNRHDVQLLQQIRSYPSLTITLPTHRTFPDNRQDPIRVKNLITQAGERLLGEFSKREIDPLLTRLEQLANSLDYRNTLDGTAFFVNQDFGRVFTLPFAMPERVVVDETFATRDLIYALNRTSRYWVLVLSEQPTRLYEGTMDSLIELREGGFPMVHEGPGGATALPNDPAVQRSVVRDERHRQFFRQVDAAFKKFAADDPLPLALVGVDRLLSFFNEVSDHRDLILTSVLGSHDKTSAHELGQLVWPQVEAALAERRRGALDQLGQAVGAQRSASGVGEVWRMAHEGRGRLLLVEKDFHYPATVDETGMQLTPADDAAAPGVMDDAVDEIIETVLDKQGQVVFLDNGELDLHQRIALVLRF